MFGGDDRTSGLMRQNLLQEREHWEMILRQAIMRNDFPSMQRARRMLQEIDARLGR